MNNTVGQIVGIFTAIVTVAIIAVLVSRNSNTAQVIREAGGVFTSALSVAVSPVSSSRRGPTSNA